MLVLCFIMWTVKASSMAERDWQEGVITGAIRRHRSLSELEGLLGLLGLALLALSRLPLLLHGLGRHHVRKVLHPGAHMLQAVISQVRCSRQISLDQSNPAQYDFRYFIVVSPESQA